MSKSGPPDCRSFVVSQSCPCGPQGRGRGGGAALQQLEQIVSYYASLSITTATFGALLTMDRGDGLNLPNDVMIPK